MTTRHKSAFICDSPPSHSMTMHGKPPREQDLAVPVTTRRQPPALRHRHTPVSPRDTPGLVFHFVQATLWCVVSRQTASTGAAAPRAATAAAVRLARRQNPPGAMRGETLKARGTTVARWGLVRQVASSTTVGGTTSRSKKKTNGANESTPPGVYPQPAPHFAVRTPRW